MGTYKVLIGNSSEKLRFQRNLKTYINRTKISNTKFVKGKELTSFWKSYNTDDWIFIYDCDEITTIKKIDILRKSDNTNKILNMPKIATKKAVTKKAVTKKVATKKVATKKVATKKVATKKVATKKPATKKPATKKVATKKVTRRKVSDGTIMDLNIQALKPGKRISINGKVYYEYRGNRSDKGKWL